MLGLPNLDVIAENRAFVYSRSAFKCLICETLAEAGICLEQVSVLAISGFGPEITSHTVRKSLDLLLDEVVILLTDKPMERTIDYLLRENYPFGLIAQISGNQVMARVLKKSNYYLQGHG